MLRLSRLCWHAFRMMERRVSIVGAFCEIDFSFAERMADRPGVDRPNKERHAGGCSL
jgi:hypothetical protein